MSLSAFSRGEETPATDVLDAIARTPLRLRVLTTLADVSLDPRDLADRTNVPRTTLRHNLDRLREAALVERTRDAEYRLTTRGRVALCGIEAYRMRIETGVRLEPFFRFASPREMGADIAWFTEAELTVSDAAHPYAPGQRLLSAIETRDAIEGFLPSFPGTSLERLRSIFGPEDGVVDLAFPAAVVDSLRVDLDDVPPRDFGTVTIRPLDGSIGYGGLLLDDAHVLCLAVDGDGKPHATIETDDDAAIAWLGRELARHRAESDRAWRPGDQVYNP